MRTTPRPNSPDGAHRTARRHVLLVEDDPRITAALGIRLASHGYRVSHAADLNEAADKMMDERPDVAVLDINLPDGNGLQLAGRMRLLRSTADVPLVFVTASRDPAYRERAAGLAASFLEKPFESRELLDAIERACAGARNGAPDHPSPER